MTGRQIAWAKQHDWFLYETQLPDRSFVATCEDRVSYLCGRVGIMVVSFDNFAELRAWAGY